MLHSLADHTGHTFSEEKLQHISATVQHASDRKKQAVLVIVLIKIFFESLFNLLKNQPGYGQHEPRLNLFSAINCSYLKLNCRQIQKRHLIQLCIT